MAWWWGALVYLSAGMVVGAPGHLSVGIVVVDLGLLSVGLFVGLVGKPVGLHLGWECLCSHVQSSDI